MAASLNTVFFLFFCQLQSGSAADPPIQPITAHPGGEVTLPCKAPVNVNISSVLWTRSDLNRYIFFKSHGHLEASYQDPSYVNRVQLKDDDLSLILKNVNSSDEGRYECRYVEETGGRRKRSGENEPISIVQLKVKGPTGGDSESGKDKSGHLGVILSVTLIVSGLVGFVTYKKRKGHSENNSDLPVVDPDVLQQLQENETSQKNITHNISDTQV